MKIYLVGGAVRDKLLGLPVTERDWVVVGATPEEMIELGFIPVGKDFPVFLHPETKEEYALARTERKTGHGYKGFAFHASPDVTLEQDLHRRDLTINAMAEDEDGTLIDPCGGQDDLQIGMLRHISPAFAEDPVRILRVARFAARFAPYGFRVAHGTNALMRKMVREGEVDYLVPERVWAELHKALQTDAPQRFFTVLRGCGALAVLFPEIDREYPQGEDGHGKREPPGALAALERAAQVSKDPAVRFAVLMQALGRDLDDTQRIAQVEALAERLKVPRAFSQLAIAAIRDSDAIAGEDPEALLKAMENNGAFRQNGRWPALLETLAAAGRIDPPRQRQLAAAAQRAAQINAAQLAGEGVQGKALGEAIRKARIDALREARA